jgi:hypothetical protein
MAVTTPTEHQDSEADGDDKRDFWAWVEQEKAELQRRVKSCNDPDLPERRARELLDELREYAVRPLSADFEAEILERARQVASDEVERARNHAEDSLREFLRGPMAWSRERKPRFKGGVTAMRPSRPQITARRAWEERFQMVLIVDAVDALYTYFMTPADEPLPEHIDQATLPIHIEPSTRGLRRVSAVSALVLLELRTREITRLRLQEAYRDAYELLDRAETWGVEARWPRDWHPEKVRAFDTVAAALGKKSDAVEKVYRSWRDA